LAPDEVLVEVVTAGVGNWDEFVRTGGWDVGGVPPMALGVEAAGRVLAVGDAASEWSLGDEVMTHPLPLRDQGTWAPRLIAPAALLAEKPSGVSWEAAAAFPVPALTAEQVLGEALAVQAGEWLLVHGAGGVTGGLLVALGALRGAHVIATAGSTSRQRVSAFGAAHVIDYRDGDWPEQVRTIAGGRGVAAAVNAVPGYAADALRAIADNGRLATITGDPPNQERGITVSNVYVRPDGDQLRTLAKHFADGTLTVPVAATYRLRDAAAALAQTNSGHAGGAVILTI
jgi:NADPH:quinone reductase-like Zn-dependent oxidoreductase